MLKQAYINPYIVGFFAITAKKAAYGPVREKAFYKPATAHAAVKRHVTLGALV